MWGQEESQTVVTVLLWPRSCNNYHMAGMKQVSVARGLHSVGAWLNKMRPERVGTDPETPPDAV